MYTVLLILFFGSVLTVLFCGGWMLYEWRVKVRQGLFPATKDDHFRRACLKKPYRSDYTAHRWVSAGTTFRDQVDSTGRRVWVCESARRSYILANEEMRRLWSQGKITVTHVAEAAPQAEQPAPVPEPAPPPPPTVPQVVTRTFGLRINGEVYTLPQGTLLYEVRPGIFRCVVGSEGTERVLQFTSDHLTMVRQAGWVAPYSNVDVDQAMDRMHETMARVQRYMDSTMSSAMQGLSDSFARLGAQISPPQISPPGSRNPQQSPNGWQISTWTETRIANPNEVPEEKPAEPPPAPASALDQILADDD
jgi:hypothetical protein